MNCAAGSGQDPYWLIDDIYHFHTSSFIAILNERGFYETDGDPRFIQLTINSTHDVNGTLIKCIDTDGLNAETTLVVYGKLL